MFPSPAWQVCLTESLAHASVCVCMHPCTGSNEAALNEVKCFQAPGWKYVGLVQAADLYFWLPGRRLDSNKLTQSQVSSQTCSLFIY